MMKIRSGDLKHPPFFYVYSCSEWRKGGTDKVAYKFLYFSLREETGEEILSVSFRCSQVGRPNNPQAMFPLAAWGYHSQARFMGKLFSLVFPGDPYGSYRRFVRGLWYLKVPRFTQAPDGKRWVPWKYRAVPDAFFQARALVYHF